MDNTNLKAVFVKSTPFSIDDFARAYDLFDTPVFRPNRLGTSEPLRENWGDSVQFCELCEEELSRYFGTVIMTRKKPRYLCNFVIQYGPKAKCHSLWLDSVIPVEFGGRDVPILRDFLDDLFDVIDFDYGFVCNYPEYEERNVFRDVATSPIALGPFNVVGMEWPDCLPGLYWCNYFGDAYFEQGFGQKIEELPYTRRLRNGYCILRSESPLDWELETESKSTQKLIDSLGRNWFFSKELGMPSMMLKTDRSLFRHPPTMS